MQLDAARVSTKSAGQEQETLKRKAACVCNHSIHILTAQRGDHAFIIEFGWQGSRQAAGAGTTNKIGHAVRHSPKEERCRLVLLLKESDFD